MNIRYIAFKWHCKASLQSVLPIIERIGFLPSQKNQWKRIMGDHTLQIEYRLRMSNDTVSYFWLHWFNDKGALQKDLLARPLSDCIFAVNGHFATCVNWMQAAIDIHEFRPLYGYAENTPRIWSRSEDKVKFSFYPIKDHYYFEIRDTDIRNPIPYKRYSKWLDELNNNLLGLERPGDQISFDLVV